MESDINPLIT